MTRFVADYGPDDMILPYAVDALDVRGRVVRLGPAINMILARHDYPAPVARAVGEAVALAILLGSALKESGRFQLQTKTDGIIDMIVVDFDAPDRVRAFARFDAARLAAAGRPEDLRSADIIGSGHFALTIDMGGDMSRYQGVVALAGQGLEEAAHQYFRQSEQIPTVIRLAVAESVTGSGRSWRAGALMAQFLPSSSQRVAPVDLDPGDAPEGAIAHEPQEDDAWREAKALAGTVEDHELVDPMLSAERLLFRLFHERGVAVFDGQAVREACRCSQEKIVGMLKSFSALERRDMIGEDGRIAVTCEFCSTKREFDPADFDPR